MTNLDSILKSRDITLSAKVHLVKVKVFPVVMYGCESWTIKKTECRRIDAFKLWCRRRLLRVPWTARRSTPVLGVHWWDWCWSWNSNSLATWWEELTHLGWPWCWERLRAGGEEDDRGWDGWMDHQFNGHGFGWTLDVGDGQGDLSSCSSWAHKESHKTERLHWTKLNEQHQSNPFHLIIAEICTVVKRFRNRMSGVEDCSSHNFEQLWT